MTIISCLKCKSKTGSQTDLRGHQPYEYEFTKLLDDVTIASVVLDKSKVSQIRVIMKESLSFSSFLAALQLH